MRVELPPGYVPPEPTHPFYGYLTPQEQEEYEAEERARAGIVPGVVVQAEAAEQEAAEQEPVAVPWAPPAIAAGRGESAAETGPLSPPLTGEEVGEPDEAVEVTVAHTGWVPGPPAEPAVVARADESTSLGAAGEHRWDARAQRWVPAASEEEPPPDVAAAAGGRGASSSWTSADGSQYRWDARAQRWVTDPA